MASPAAGPRSAVGLQHEADNRLEGRAGEEDFVGALAPHAARIGLRNRAPASSKQADVAAAAAVHVFAHIAEELDVAAVVGGDADGRDALLNRSPRNVAGGAMEAEIHHLDAVVNELDVQGVDGAVVAITDGNSGEQPNWPVHESP